MIPVLLAVALAIAPHPRYTQAVEKVTGAAPPIYCTPATDANDSLGFTLSENGVPGYIALAPRVCGWLAAGLRPPSKRKHCSDSGAVRVCTVPAAGSATDVFGWGLLVLAHEAGHYTGIEEEACAEAFARRHWVQLGRALVGPAWTPTRQQRRMVADLDASLGYGACSS